MNFSASLIRTSHLTGTGISINIGLITYRLLRGNRKNYWKLKVLCGAFGRLVLYRFGRLLTSYHALFVSMVSYIHYECSYYAFVSATHVLSLSLSQ